MLKSKKTLGFAKHISIWKAALCLLILFCSVASAQKGHLSGGHKGTKDTPTTQNLTSAGDGFSGVQNPKWGLYGEVSAYDGSLNYNLPLLSMAGRGEVSFTPTLKIRGQWEVETEIDDYSQPPDYYYHPVYIGTNEPSYGNYFNLAVGYSPGVVIFQRSSTPTADSWGEGLTRVYFYGSGGEVVELRDASSQGRRIRRSTVNGINRGRHFVSNDGSAMTFISDMDVRDVPYCPNPFSCNQPYPYPVGVLKFSNGTEYRIDNGAVTSIRDRNGNKMQFTYYPSGTVVYGATRPGPIHTATDSNGRTILFEYGVQESAPYGNCTRITYSGFGGSPRTIRISQKHISNTLRSGEIYRQSYELFPDADGGYNEVGDVISAVWFPDGKSYKFLYNSYGELTRVELPLGAAIEYDFLPTIGDGGGFIDDAQSSRIYRRVSERRTYRNGTALEKKELFDFEPGECTSDCWYGWNQKTTATIKSFDGQTNAQIAFTKHYFYGMTQGVANGGGYGDYTMWRTGREYKTEVLDANNNVLKRTETDWAQRAYVPWWNVGCTYMCPPLEASPAVDTRVTEVRSIDVPANQFSKIAYGYDEFNNQTDIREYDFAPWQNGQGAAGNLLRYVHTDFLRGDYIGNYYASSPHIRRAPERQWVSSDTQGTVKLTYTENEYDNYASDAGHAPLLSRTNVVGHDSAGFGPNTLLRGNVTGIKSYENAQNQTAPVSAYSQYDILGNIVKKIDAKGNVATFNFADNFGSPDGEARTNSSPSQLNGQSTFAFATSGANALNWVTGYNQYDYFTGAIVNAEDMNGIVAKTLYDFADRKIQTVYAVGTSYESQSTIVYDDANRRIETKKDLYTLNDNLDRDESYYDCFGKTIETRKYDTNGYTATKMEYDASGRTKRTSDPYRPPGEPPKWTEYFFDALGRTIKTKTPDYAETITEFFGNVITVTDQSGNKRRSISNALEKVIRVDEPNDQGELGTVANPTQPTSYVYTATGNLVKVTQGAQNRYFLYNSLGRLIRVRQPEQATHSSLALSDPITGNSAWSTGSTFDPVGNVLTLTTAGGATVTNTYDALDRVLTKTYSDGTTPTITYTYDDVNVPNSKGKPTKINNGVSISEYTGYDPVGRLISYRQTTDGQSYDTGYTYNLSGALIEQTYPSGRKIKNDFDADGELQSVKSQKSPGAALRTLAGNFVRNSSGAITSMKLGNGLFETAKLNDRLQITELALGTTNTNANLWKVNFAYGTTNNNGNVLSQTINTGASTFVQTYEYDFLNRITEARELIGTQQNWIQNFGYDIFGNRTQFSQLVGAEQLQINNLTLPQVDAGSNRYMTGQGYEYDSNGNLTKDATGQNFTFNGENKISQVKDNANNVVALYFYDGNGRRVKKVTVEEVIIFVYDSNGKLIAEYSTKNVDNPKISYITRDHLGTPRVMTDASRQVISRRDYMPFGETITANRPAAQKYGIEDNIRQGFTGYQKDKETGLDFAEARYYSSNHGRFTTVDPLIASGKGPNPQTFNRYSYCINRPLVAIDPSGLSFIIVLVDSNRNARIFFHTLEYGSVFGASTKGQGPRTQMKGDTPFGLYKFTGTEGGNYNFRSPRLGSPESWGAGIITTTPTNVGEGTWARRAGVFIHGGGGDNPFAPTQGCNCLPSTWGCIKMFNKDVITLIGQINKANADGDTLDRIYIGDLDYLLKMAKEKDGRGKWKYPELRDHFCAELRTCTTGAARPPGPELKFAEFDPYAVDEPALDGDIEEEPNGLAALSDDDEEFEDDGTDPRDFEQPHDYG